MLAGLNLSRDWGNGMDKSKYMVAGGPGGVGGWRGTCKICYSKWLGQLSCEVYSIGK